MELNSSPQAPGKPGKLIGSLGHLAIFLWALSSGLFTPEEHELLVYSGIFFILCLLYPSAIYRLTKPRWILIFMSLFILNVLFEIEEKDLLFGLRALSFETYIPGIIMTLRALIVLLAAGGLATSVDVSEVTRLFEHIGLKGIGFSAGVAINLLPNLLQSSTHAWHSFRMRGGLRAQWWRGLKLLMLTILTNALRRSEEIVLAAEVRAFQPQQKHGFPIRRGKLDWIMIALGFVLLVVSIVGKIAS